MSQGLPGMMTAPMDHHHAWARQALLSNEQPGQARPKEGLVVEPKVKEMKVKGPNGSKRFGDEEPEDREASDMLEPDKAGGTCRCCAEPGGVWSLGPKMKQAGFWSWFTCGREPTDAEVEKMVTSAEAAVILNIYALGNSEVVQRSVSSDTRNFLSNAGAFHVAVEICGTEWSYGYAETEGLGIFYHEPRKCPNHSFVKAIYLGDCKKKAQEICTTLVNMKSEWPAKAYDIFSKSSWHFAMALVHKLGVGTLPSGLNRQHRQGPIPSHVKVELRTTQQIPAEYQHSFHIGLAKLSGQR